VVAKRRPAVDKGYPLIEALERSTDPATWASHMVAERGCVKLGIIPAPFSLFPSISSDDDWDYWEKLSTLRKKLVRKLMACLRSGERPATGILEPVSAASKRVPIAPHLWDVLEPDLEDSSARASNLGYVAVRVHQSRRAALASAGNRSGDPRQDADIKARIQQVHAAAQKVCNQKDRAIGLKTLAEAIKRTGGYGADTIRSILNGTYEPARVRGFRRFVWKRSKQ
jgi:hypothetical protein